MNVSAVSSSPVIPSPKPPATTTAAPASTPAFNGPGLSSSALAPGLYVHVIDGMINLSNSGGSQTFSAGQFGYTGSVVQAPVVVPTNPGVQFNPPPAFSSQSTAPVQKAIDAYTANSPANVIVVPPKDDTAAAKKTEAFTPVNNVVSKKP